MHSEFVRSSENLYVIDLFSNDPDKIYEIDFGEMKCVSCERTGEEYALFCGVDKHFVIGTHESLAWHRYSQDRMYHTHKSGKCMFYIAKMWYFFHDSLTVNVLKE